MARSLVKIDPRVFAGANNSWDMTPSAYGDENVEAPSIDMVRTAPSTFGASGAFAPASSQPDVVRDIYQPQLRDVGQRLNEAFQPPQRGFGGNLRALAGALFARRNPQLGAMISGDYGRMRNIDALQKQYNLIEDAINQNRAMNTADITNRLHTAQAKFFEQRPDIEEAKQENTQQQKKNAVEQQLRSKGLQGVWDDNYNLLDTKPAPTNQVPGAKKYIPDVDPKTRQPFYRVLNHMGQEVGRVDVNAIPSLMQKESQTNEWKTDVDGNLVSVPKTTVTSPVLPGGAPAQKPVTGTPKSPIKMKTPDMVVGSTPEGVQVAGTPEELRAANIQGVTKLPSSESSKVVIARQLTSPGGLFDLAQKDLAKFSPGELEGLAPRWNEFLAGTYGTADPRYIALRTHVNGLLSTALLQAHVGARGGEHMMEHFQDIANAGKMSRETLKAALDAEKQYVNEKAMRIPQKSSGGAAAGGVVRDSTGKIDWKQTLGIN